MVREGDIFSPHLVAIVGPTGVGKTHLALQLGQICDGEIVSADSRQVYRFMDIGTAKPKAEELSLVPHHLINIVNLDEAFSLAQYQTLAFQAIADIQQRYKLPLLVGGSGLYVWAVLENWRIPQVPPNHEFRENLKKIAQNQGVEQLYQELLKVDPVAAQKIDPRNVRRVIRALEVYRQTNIPFSQFQRTEAPPFDIFIIGLTADRAELYRRADCRIDEMIAVGLIDEVKKLAKLGYSYDLPAMSGIGYKQVGLYLRGELTLEEATKQMKYETHRFIRHQYAWFRLQDPRIHWFDITKQTNSEIVKAVAQFFHQREAFP